MENPSPRQLYKLAASCFIVDEQGHVLILKRREDDRLLPGYWQAPGGAIETGEGVEAGLAREVKEQTGLDVTCDDLFGYFTYADAKHQICLNLNFRCTRNNPAQTVTPGHDLVEAVWTDIPGLANHEITPETYEACRKALEGKK